MTLIQKMEHHIETRITSADCKTAFAIPGQDNIIDLIHPVTGKSLIYSHTLKQVQMRYHGAEVVNVDDFFRAKAVRQDAPVDWQETTEKEYWDMLEVLPPAFMGAGGFLVGEPWDHHAITGRPRFQAFQEVAGKFLKSSRPMTIAEYRERKR